MQEEEEEEQDDDKIEEQPEEEEEEEDEEDVQITGATGKKVSSTKSWGTRRSSHIRIPSTWKKGNKVL